MRKDYFSIVLSIGTVFLLIFMIGCSGEETSTDEGDQTITVAFNQSIVSLDPHGSNNGSQSTLLAARQIYDTLVVNENGEFKESVAEEWTQEDPNTWIFYLRDDVTFHDGEQLTATDVKASLERLASSDSPLSGLWGNLDQVEAVDESTLKITTIEPLGTMLSNLSLMFIVPADKADDEEFFRKPIGSGPFMVESFASEQELVTSAFPEYWNGPAELNKLTFLDIPEDSSRITALNTGEIDITWTIPPDQISELESTDNITLESAPGYLYYFTWFNSSEEPFDDVRVRRAMLHAIDSETIIDSLFSGVAEELLSPIPSSVFGYSEQEPYEFNPELSRELLEDAGYPDGFSTSVIFDRSGGPQIQQLMDIMRSYWADIGVTVELEASERAEWLERLLALDWEMDLQTNTVITGDADYTLGRLYTSEANRTGYKNEELDEYLAQAQTTTDLDERQELYAKASEIIWEDAVGLFPLQLNQVYALRSNIVNFDPDPAGTPSFLNVELE